MNVDVTHVTKLEYSQDVVEAVMDAHVGPLDDRDQLVEQYELRLDPAGSVRRYLDGFGNVTHLLSNTRPHTRLELTARSRVRTLLSDPFAVPQMPPTPLSPIEQFDALQPSKLVTRLPLVDEMAAPFRPATSAETFDSVRRLSEMIHTQFTYQQYVTDVATTVEQTLVGRRGVCQDFAHLLLGLCRSLEIPARYVSGYLVMDHHHADRGGRAPRRGARASHAWVEAFTPTHGWRGFDPTNNLVANEYYVKVAIGRDYADVPPTRGTFRGAAHETLAVEVSAVPRE